MTRELLLLVIPTTTILIGTLVWLVWTNGSASTKEFLTALFSRPDSDRDEAVGSKIVLYGALSMIVGGLGLLLLVAFSGTLE